MGLEGVSLTDAYGAPFRTVQSPMTTPGMPPGNATKGVQLVVEKMEPTLPLDTNPATRNFTPDPVAVQSSMGSQPDKLSRILALVEQNKTGYEPSSSRDMFLYVATGVMFLFTFDTFVTLGRSMR